MPIGWRIISVREGVGPEVRVGLIVDDPLNQIVAVLGVLKAGGAYVPLEPSLPQTRLDGMLDAARVSDRDRRRRVTRPSAADVGNDDRPRRRPVDHRFPESR